VVVLEALHAGARERLGARLVGLYLYGSLATGDFSPETSDIDFAIATEGELDARDVERLAALHAELKARGRLFAVLEGSYIPRAALRRFDPAHARHPHLSHERPFGFETHGPDWVIQYHVMREYGAAIAGPPARELIDPVTPDELRGAVRGVLDGFWAGFGASDAFLRERAYQVFAVQTMCRALHTLEQGAISSKPVALRWARAALPAEFQPAIARALDFPGGDQRDDLDGTRALIAFTRQRASRS
jgi:predicted nucleotidyltransferase